MAFRLTERLLTEVKEHRSVGLWVGWIDPVPNVTPLFYIPNKNIKKMTWHQVFYLLLLQAEITKGTTVRGHFTRTFVEKKVSGALWADEKSLLSLSRPRHLPSVTTTSKGPYTEHILRWMFDKGRNKSIANNLIFTLLCSSFSIKKNIAWIIAITYEKINIQRFMHKSVQRPLLWFKVSVSFSVPLYSDLISNKKHVLGSRQDKRWVFTRTNKTNNKNKSNNRKENSWILYM